MVTGLSVLSNTGVALLTEEGRIFGLDAQLLFDILIQGIAVFLLFTFVSYLFINPVRDMLEKRQAKIAEDIASAAKDKEEAAKMKTEYDAKIKDEDTEVSETLSAARNQMETPLP